MRKLKIAIQKSGRLREESLKLLKQSGISVDNGQDQLKTCATNFPLEIYYLRNSDIYQYLIDGVVDIAILGENTLYENGSNLPVVCKLGFSKCRVSMAVPKEVKVEGMSYFEGKQIATSYPKTLEKFLSSNEISASIHKISGSVEIAPNIGLADAIMDIVSSGNTLFKNGLKESTVVLESEAVLVKGDKLDADLVALIDQLNFRINAVLGAKQSRYVLMNVPNDKIDAISQLLPVLKSPTIMPLAMEGWSSLHTVISENEFWPVIDGLKAQGAEGILVLPIEKIIL